MEKPSRAFKYNLKATKHKSIWFQSSKIVCCYIRSAESFKKKTLNTLTGEIRSIRIKVSSQLSQNETGRSHHHHQRTRMEKTETKRPPTILYFTWIKLSHPYTNKYYTATETGERRKERTLTDLKSLDKLLELLFLLYKIPLVRSPSRFLRTTRLIARPISN